MKLSTETQSRPKVPAGESIFAVGDVHGRLDLLEGATHEICSRIASGEAHQSTVVFLGDYIDRGPAARGVIDHLLSFEASARCKCVFLRGNHEQVLLDLLNGEEQSTRWLGFGGAETLASYGVDNLPSKAADDVAVLRALISDVIPAEHRAFLERTEFYVQIGDYLFVHAGLRPDRLLEEQALADFLWYRYYDEQTPLWSETVVHGHTVSSRPVRGRWRIGIDTGAYSSGNLTVLSLSGGHRALWRVRLASARRTEVTLWDTSERSPHTSDDAAVVEPREDRMESRKVRYEQRKRWPVIGLVVAATALIGLAGWIVVAAPDAFSRTPTSEVTVPVYGSSTRMPSVAEASGRAPPAVAKPGDNASPTDLNALVADAPTPPAPSHKSDTARAPTTGPWVQISALPTAAQAEQAWDDLARALPADMKDKRMAIFPISVKGKTLFRSYVEGFADVAAARTFCGRLVAMGRDCIVRTA